MAVCEALHSSPTSFGACLCRELWRSKSDVDEAYIAPLGHSPDRSVLFPVNGEVALGFGHSELDVVDEDLANLLKLKSSRVCLSLSRQMDIYAVA